MQTPPLSDDALRHGLSLEPSVSDGVMPFRLPVVLPKKRSRAYSFEQSGDSEPVFKAPIAFLAYALTPELRYSGVVYFKNQVWNLMKHLPDSCNVHALPGRSVHLVLGRLREKYKDDLREFGTPPMTRVESGGVTKKPRSSKALLLAKQGNFDAINEDPFLEEILALHTAHVLNHGTKATNMDIALEGVLPTMQTSNPTTNKSCDLDDIVMDPWDPECDDPKIYTTL